MKVHCWAAAAVAARIIINLVEFYTKSARKNIREKNKKEKHLKHVNLGNQLEEVNLARVTPTPRIKV